MYRRGHFFNDEVLARDMLPLFGKTTSPVRKITSSMLSVKERSGYTSRAIGRIWPNVHVFWGPSNHICPHRLPMRLVTHITEKYANRSWMEVSCQALFPFLQTSSHTPLIASTRQSRSVNPQKIAALLIMVLHHESNNAETIQAPFVARYHRNEIQRQQRRLHMLF